MTLKNQKILSVNKKLKYSYTTDTVCTKYFEIAGIRFDIYEENNKQSKIKTSSPSKLNDSYFGINLLTPIIISTRERLLGPYSYRELKVDE